TLGVGLIWCLALCVMVVGLVVAFRTQIAQFLLHDPGQADVVVLATITGAVWAIFKIAEMVIWFEGRALTYALIEAARPAFNLLALAARDAAAAGVKGASRAQTIATTPESVIGVALIWKRCQLGFGVGAQKEIVERGKVRAPIAAPMSVVQNADLFILCRF